MGARLDRSERSVVVYCPDCPGWADVALSDERAHTLAVSHDARVHPGDERARAARDQWAAREARRHAADARQSAGA